MDSPWRRPQGGSNPIVRWFPCWTSSVDRVIAMSRSLKFNHEFGGSIGVDDPTPASAGLSRPSHPHAKGDNRQYLDIWIAILDDSRSPCPSVGTPIRASYSSKEQTLCPSCGESALCEGELPVAIDVTRAGDAKLIQTMDSRRFSRLPRAGASFGPRSTSLFNARPPRFNTTSSTRIYRDIMYDALTSIRAKCHTGRVTPGLSVICGHV